MHRGFLTIKRHVADSDSLIYKMSTGWVHQLDDDQPRQKLDPNLYTKFLKSVKIIQDSFDKGYYQFITQ
jgi:hypothetical protein